MAHIGYARVSTQDQHLHLQQDALNKAGCIKIFTDTASGAKHERPGLGEALNYVREGDIPTTSFDMVAWGDAVCGATGKPGGFSAVPLRPTRAPQQSCTFFGGGPAQATSSAATP
jgi:hypothetical protein